MVYKYAFSEATEDVKINVWKKGKKIVQNGKELDENIWQSDMCGGIMKYSDHGDTESKYGWEIDHIKPLSKGGSDELGNLQPLYWKNNRTKGDTYPWSCP